MDLATIGTLYRYNSWANERVLDAASRLTEAEFIRELKSSYGSIRDTLTHIVWSEWIWLQRWKGESPTLVFSPSDFPNAESLRERLHKVAADRSTFLRDLSAERVLKPMEYRNIQGEVWRYPLWQQLYHLVNHSTYHRGQVATMMRQLGATPAATDFLVYYDQGGRPPGSVGAREVP
ncbi:MAG: DinB family protein [Vicinamibacteria bacterium]